MKTIEECQQWVRDFLDWTRAAPEGCETVRPLNGAFWQLDNCTQNALEWHKMYWGGSITSTANDRVLLLDFNINEHAFRFCHRKPTA